MRLSTQLFFTIITFILLIAETSSFAAYLKFIPLEITQPDGEVIACFASGDEFYNWVHDQNGYTIVKRKEDGFFYYAVLKGGELIPSKFKAGTDLPDDSGLTPWTNISAEKIKGYRQEFMQNYMPAKPHREGCKNPSDAESFSVINNLVVYIRFSDQAEFVKDTAVYYDMYNNDAEGYNSQRNYFYEASYGTLEMPSWFFPVPDGPTVISYKDIYPRSHFLPYDANSNPDGYGDWQDRVDREHSLLKRACAYIENEVPLSIDLDNNGDGYVDNTIFTIKGGPSAWSTLLWPHRWVLFSENVYINGKQVWDYNFQIESHLDENGNGVLCHETGHTLGMPDLYHYGASSITSVGRWDLMDQNRNPPQHMGAYMKYRYCDWVDQIPEITECGIYELNPLTSPDNNCFKIASPNSSQEYFVLEYRVKGGTFESNIPGSGLVVYRIDEKLDGEGNAGGPPDEVYIFRPGGDPDRNGNLNLAALSANTGRTAIHADSDPYPFLQDGQAGGLNIVNIGKLGETISFEVILEKEPVAGFSTTSTLLAAGCETDFTDNSFCNVTGWEWTFEGGNPATSNEQNPAGIMYETTGTFDVTLRATNEFGASTVKLENYITVSNSAIPEVDFVSSETLACSGDTIILTDLSEVCPVSWSWKISPDEGVEFVTGTSAADREPRLVLRNPGSYTVKSTVTNANGSASLTKEAYLTIGGLDVPYEQDFEDNAIAVESWTVISNDNDITWEDFFASGNGGKGAAGIDNYDYYKFLERDQLISPPLDLSNHENALLYFDHAYALKGDDLDYSDTLNVKISDDCGETWTVLLSLVEDGSGNFVTREAINTRFVPESEDDWCGSGYGSDCNGIDISTWAGKMDILVMFESVRIMGNNLYIDNVRVGPSPGIESINAQNETLTIFPNPASGKVNITLDDNMATGTVNVFNSGGQKVYSETVINRSSNAELDLTGLPRGLYFIHLSGDDFTKSGKVIIR
jgi:M6 family metalloprotease-like protein